ncbi:MAG TPA: hypothetical protein VI564_02955 [Candidatus Nanoarchaeia archaeon]|nr:hypothetical protein [Candidatus Nanoarchaeia archaeon]
MDKTKIRNGITGGLTALVLALSSGGCGVKVENQNSGDVKTPAVHSHQSEVYAPGLDESKVLEMEKDGSSVFVRPYSVSIKGLKEHIGEYTILQEGFNPEIRTDSYLTKKLGPLIDGKPDEKKLYQPLAMKRDSNLGLDVKVPRLYAESKDQGFKVLNQYPVYSNEADTRRDIERVERVLRYMWDDSSKPNIRLVPIKITEELISEYANK